MNPDNQAENRNPDGTFKEGVSGNPAGRPKGKSLKEFVRGYLESLSDEDKLLYIEKLPKDIVWKMAEGNPKQDNSTELSGEITEKRTLVIVKDNGQA
jgi:hypothetical protein